MENKNFYPIRLGSSGVIVTDTPLGPDALGGANDKEYYGGYLIAESVHSPIAQQLVDAYNEKYYIPKELTIKPSRYNSLKEGEVYGLCGIDYFYQANGKWHVHIHAKGDYQDSGLVREGNYIFTLMDTKSAPSFTDGLTVPPIKNELFNVEPLEIDVAEFMKTGIEKPNEKYGPQSKSTRRYPLIITVGDPYSSRYRKIKVSSLMTNVNDITEVYGVMDKIRPLLEEDGLVIIFPDNKDVPSALNSTMWNELVNKADVAITNPNTHYIDNPPKSYEEEEKNRDIGLFNIPKPTLDQQIEWVTMNLTTKELGHAQDFFIAIKENLLAIKMWNASPAYHGKVDVEKVIEDLLHFCHYAVKHMTKNHLVGYDFPKLHDNLMNAEAALGMLQAFKEKREEKKTHEMVKNLMAKQPFIYLKPEKVLVTPDEREKLLNDLLDVMQQGIPNAVEHNSFVTCNTIIFAIESYLTKLQCNTK